MIIVQKPEQTLGKEVALTMGFFDGVHAGHRTLIERVMQVSQMRNLGSAVLTFWPHPRLVLQKDPEKLRFLTTLTEKSKIVSKLGVDFLIIKEFTPDFYNMEAEDFVRHLVNEFHVRHFVVGSKHRFGKGGRGDTALLRELSVELSYTLEVVETLQVEGQGISSTKIREALLSGNVDMANQMLGYPYLITGSVESGKKVGREIGFPTANIRPNDPLKLIPREGVYAVVVSIEGSIKFGMMNIGFRPTVDSNRKQTIEVNIFDFDDEIYFSGIEVALIARLRNEKRFPSIKELSEQLAIDKIDALNILQTHNPEVFQNLFLTLRPSK